MSIEKTGKIRSRHRRPPPVSYGPPRTALVDSEKSFPNKGSTDTPTKKRSIQFPLTEVNGRNCRRPWTGRVSVSVGQGTNIRPPGHIDTGLSKIILQPFFRYTLLRKHDTVESAIALEDSGKLGKYSQHPNFEAKNEDELVKFDVGK